MNARTAIAWLKKSGKPAVKKGMARYAIEFLRTLELVERGASDERNFVKKAVSWALRGIGKRSRPRLTSCRFPPRVPSHDPSIIVACRASVETAGFARMPRPNWFFAFPLDGAFLRALGEPPKSIRLYHPDDAHMTLAFLGGCTQEAALRALAVLDARIVSDPPPVLDVTLGEVVPLGRSKSGYTTLSALLSRGREEATALLTAHRDPLHEAATGARPKRPAKPHVTLARVRGRASAESRDAGLAWAASLDLRRVHARLDRIALYTWAESRKERLFRIVAERSLSASSLPT